MSHMSVKHPHDAGKPVGEGKIGEVATRIHNKFRDIATGKDSQYESWLYYVN